MAGASNFPMVIKKMKITLTALTVGATLFAGSASAFDPDDLQNLKNNNICIGCGLKSADLYKADLSGANLSGASLSNANLMDVNLSGADLRGAITNGAILCNTIMPDGSVIYSGC